MKRVAVGSYKLYEKIVYSWSTPISVAERKTAAAVGRWLEGQPTTAQFKKMVGSNSRWTSLKDGSQVQIQRNYKIIRS